MKINAISKIQVDASAREVAEAMANAWAFEKAAFIDYFGYRYINETFVDGLVKSIIDEVNDGDETDYTYVMDFLLNLKNVLNKYYQRGFLKTVKGGD